MTLDKVTPNNKNMPIDLSVILEDDLFSWRICDLPVSISGTWLEECIETLYQELDDKGLLFKPVCYLSDEWLTPENEPVIGIPFYLTHPTLIKLEKKMMLEAEGDTKDTCMKLLRHETGHAIAYAFGLNKKKRWKEIFGSSSEEYKETYRYRPYSKNYVRHLDGFYAQLHPDEDFVETFAVWLTPGCDWEKQYQGWKVLHKLKYVDELMSSIKGKVPQLKKKSRMYWNYKTLRITLRNFYKKKRQFRAEEFPDFHDTSLKRIFVERSDPSQSVVWAADIIKKYRRHLVNDIARWTGERKYVINDLLKTFHKRCRQLKLVAKDEESLIVCHVTAYLTTLIMNYFYTGWYQGDKQKRNI